MTEFYRRLGRVSIPFTFTLLTSLVLNLMTEVQAWAADTTSEDQCPENFEQQKFTLSNSIDTAVLRTCIGQSEDVAILKDLTLNIFPGYDEALFTADLEERGRVVGLNQLVFDGDLSQTLIIAKRSHPSTGVTKTPYVVIRWNGHGLSIYPGYQVSELEPWIIVNLPTDLQAAAPESSVQYSPSEDLLTTPTLLVGDAEHLATQPICESTTNLDQMFPKIEGFTLALKGCNSLAADISGHTVRTIITQLTMTDLENQRSHTLVGPELDQAIYYTVTHHNTHDRLFITLAAWQLKLCINFDPGDDLSFMPENPPLELESPEGVCPRFGQESRYGIKLGNNPSQLFETSEHQSDDLPHDEAL